VCYGLRYSIDTGEITSKSGAGRYGIAAFDEQWHPLISHALSVRGTPTPAVAPTDTADTTARRNQTLDFMRLVIDGA
jgi:hypothetical protein